ncbi:hypothetical protein, partial [Chamaesiphon sp. VAR_69_metabat_338]|uniref:hypothetical protein n=1 Tax=Chamaesiphon sp. VAR_69_metabat_338 TaxID=2964704 RepID=UPI00286D73A0
MTLDRQVEALINGAPDEGSRTSVMAIAPTLRQVAETLPQTTYYICQSPQGEWVVTTLSNRQKPSLEINVIYAFINVEDVGKFNGGVLANSLAIEVPIVQLLFYLLAFPEIDRLILLNDSQNLDRGREISRDELEAAIGKQVQPEAGSGL